jgi:hypothetical protein
MRRVIARERSRRTTPTSGDSPRAGSGTPRTHCERRYPPQAGGKTAGPVGADPEQNPSHRASGDGRPPADALPPGFFSGSTLIFAPGSGLFLGIDLEMMPGCQACVGGRPAILPFDRAPAGPGFGSVAGHRAKVRVDPQRPPPHRAPDASRPPARPRSMGLR